MAHWRTLGVGRVSHRTAKSQTQHGSVVVYSSPKEGHLVLTASRKSVRVFLSSTYRDLQQERTAVEEALNQLHTIIFAGMEYFGSNPDTPLNISLREVARSNIYIGLFGARYGYVDPKTGRSITELEYREARQRDLPCFIYLSDTAEKASEDKSRAKKDSDAYKLARLKRELKKNYVVSFFRGPDHLATRVVLDLANYLFESRMPQANRAPVTPTGTDRRALHALMATRLDLEELKILCFNLGIDFENLDGHSKAGMARSLIEYMERRKRTEQLVAELRRMRPDID
jgi:hypothetical protein